MVDTRSARILLGLQGVIFGGLSTVFIVSPRSLSADGPGGKPGTAPVGLVRDLGLTKQLLAAFMLFVAARSSREQLREMLWISVPFKLLAAAVQISSGSQWFSVGVSEGLTGVVNGVFAMLLK